MIDHPQPGNAADLIITARHDGTQWHTIGTLLDVWGQEIQSQEFVTDWPLDSAYLTAAFDVQALELITASRATDPADRVRYRAFPRPPATEPDPADQDSADESAGHHNGTPTYRGFGTYHFPSDTDRS